MLGLSNVGSCQQKSSSASVMNSSSYSALDYLSDSLEKDGKINLLQQENHFFSSFSGVRSPKSWNLIG